MKLKLVLIALLLYASSTSAQAARNAGLEDPTLAKPCVLTAYQSAVLTERWNKLSMRHFFAAMEREHAPVAFARTAREVQTALADLKREFGTGCVLEIK